jgi:hypothetical protein
LCSLQVAAEEERLLEENRAVVAAGTLSAASIIRAAAKAADSDDETEGEDAFEGGGGLTVCGPIRSKQQAKAQRLSAAIRSSGVGVAELRALSMRALSVYIDPTVTIAF